MARDPKEINKLFVKSMTAIAVELEKPVSEVSKPQFFAKNTENLSEWDIRKAGGFDSLKKMNFAPDHNLEVKYGSRLVRSHINKVDKAYGQRSFIQNEILDVINDIMSKVPLNVHPQIKPKKATVSPTKRRTIVAHLSDTHYGANIDKKEMGGINEFNWTIAARRTAFFVEQISQYKPQYRKDTDVVLVVNGDLIAGVIHDQAWFADLLAVQFAGALDIMVQAISYLALNFNNVRVEWTSGNHGRAQHKPDKGRATTHKWDSYETMIALATKKALSGYKNVEFNIPTTPYNIVEIQGHMFFVTHGDTVFKLPNPGKSINVKDLNTQIAKLNASELQGTGKKFAGILCGHVHVATMQLTESGCMMIINGCLSGTDPFAGSIGIFDNHPTQQLFEVTKDHPVGDVRFIRVESADKRVDMDKIIKPFSGSIS